MSDDRMFNSGGDAYPRPRRALSGILLVVYVAVFLLEEIYVDNRLSRIQFINSTFALSLDGLKQGYLWQLLTYQFMHGGYVHLLFNCLVLHYVGRTVETLLGRPAFVLVFFGGGLVGGLVQCLTALLPGGVDVPVVGASGGLMALLGVICWQFWTQRLRLLIMFIIPVNLTGRSMLILLTIIDVGGALLLRDNIAHYAHLGGLYTGFLAMKYLFGRRYLG
jgi:membrane associated rhomboid family serine protease